MDAHNERTMVSVGWEAKGEMIPMKKLEEEGADYAMLMELEYATQGGERYEGTLMAIGYPWCLTQDDTPYGIMLIDDHNGFNNMN